MTKVGLPRRSGGFTGSRAGQILRSHLVYIRGAGHVVCDSHSRWYNYRGRVTPPSLNHIDRENAK
jgi:hypothetical protein